MSLARALSAFWGNQQRSRSALESGSSAPNCGAKNTTHPFPHPRDVLRTSKTTDGKALRTLWKTCTDFSEEYTLNEYGSEDHARVASSLPREYKLGGSRLILSSKIYVEKTPCSPVSPIQTSLGRSPVFCFTGKENGELTLPRRSELWER